MASSPPETGLDLTISCPDLVSGSSSTSSARSSARSSHDASFQKQVRTGRISKAKKGLKVNLCESCGKSYARLEHLRRHQQNHSGSALRCVWPNCGKSFHRADLFERHCEWHRNPSQNDDDATRRSFIANENSYMPGGAGLMAPPASQPIDLPVEAQSYPLTASFEDLPISTLTSEFSQFQFQKGGVPDISQYHATNYYENGDVPVDVADVSHVGSMFNDYECSMPPEFSVPSSNYASTDHTIQYPNCLYDPDLYPTYHPHNLARAFAPEQETQRVTLPCPASTALNQPFYWLEPDRTDQRYTPFHSRRLAGSSNVTSKDLTAPLPWLGVDQTDKPHAYFSSSHVGLPAPSSYESAKMQEKSPKKDLTELMQPLLEGRGATEAELKQSGTELKKKLVDDLMRTAFELLGYDFSDSSQSCSSDTSFDESDQDMGSCGSEAEPSDGSGRGRQHVQNTGSKGRIINSTSSGTPSASNNKRRLGSNDQTPDGDEEENDKKRQKGSIPLKFQPTKRNFACPFYKQSPEIHGASTSCVYSGFTTIHRLKEHLYRVHIPSGYECPVCLETFEDNNAVVAHLTKADRCVAVDGSRRVNSLNADQLKRLKIRTRTKGGNEDEERWRKIYRICFLLPEDSETPSPYCDPVLQGSPASHAVQMFEQFQHEHLPNMIRVELEAAIEGDAEVEQVAERLSHRVPDIIRECLRRIHDIYPQGPISSTLQYHDDGQPEDTRIESNLPNEPTAESTTPGNAAGPPISFTAPPETSHGMTSNEARDVSLLSSQRATQISDSGYGSATLDLQSVDRPHSNRSGHEANSPDAIQQTGDGPPRSLFPQLEDLPHMPSSGGPWQGSDLWGIPEVDTSNATIFPDALDSSISDDCFHSLIMESSNEATAPDFSFDADFEPV